MTHQRRLLVVTSTWPLHGADHRTPFVRNLTLDLAARGWTIDVLAPHAAGALRQEIDGPLRIKRFRYMLPERLQVLAYGAGGLINLRSGWRKFLALPFVVVEICVIRAAIWRLRPDVIHAHWLLPQGFSACLAAWGAKIPVVTTIHGGDVFGLAGRIFRPFKRFAVRHAAALTVNGPLTRRMALDLGAAPEKVVTIRLAPAFESKVALDQVTAWRARFSDDAKILLFVGRLVPEKGPADFVKVIAATKDRRLCGVICGDGPMREELLFLAHELGVADRLHFDGWLAPDEIAIRMAGADALLFPSKRSPEGWVEAQGVVLVEAMRARLPILAARSGGIPDLIVHGETGWLFPEADIGAMAALADALAAEQLRDTAQILDRAQQIALTEITRENSSAAFDDLFTQLMTAPNTRQGLAPVP